MLEPKSFAGAMVRPLVRHLLGRVLDGADDVVIAGTPAEIALEGVTDLGLRRPRGALQELVGRHDHARRAEPALQPVLLPEPLLDRMELAVLGQPLDGENLGPVRLDGEYRASLGRLAVDHDRAGAALA